MKDSIVKKCVTDAGLDIAHIVEICMEDIKVHIPTHAVVVWSEHLPCGRQVVG